MAQIKYFRDEKGKKKLQIKQKLKEKSLFFSTVWQHFGNLSELDKFNKSTSLIKEEILNFSSPIPIK